MQLHDQDVVDFLSGPNTVRDGTLVGLVLTQGENEWDPVLHLTFDVPLGSQGNTYVLTLRGNLSFDYDFSSESTLEQIAFVKCLWIEGQFHLSLDPWMESERFVSEQDNDYFRSRSASLTVSRSDS